MSLAWPKISAMSRAQPAGGGRGVELGLDHDPAADDVQAAGEPQHRRDLGLAVSTA